jgi:cytochrome c biogenesis protein
MGTTVRWLRRLWQTLGSSRLAVILLAALLLSSMLGSLVPQMPADPAAREPWLAAVALRYGHATGLLRALGLFRVYHAPWFLALLAAVLLSTLACTAQRLPRIWRLFTVPPTVARPEAFYEGAAHRTEWPVSSLQQALDATQNVLARHRYSVHVEQDEGGPRASVYAERGRWARAATLVSHLAALLLAFAVAARPALGWQETGLLLAPGQAYTVAHGPGFALQPGLPTLDRHPGGQLRGFRVPVTVLVDGTPQFTQTTGINHPLTFHGVAFHLQGYGPAARLTSPAGSADLAFTGVQAQEVTLPENALTLRVAYHPEGPALYVSAVAADGSLLGSGMVADGQQVEVQGIPVTFTLSHYTIWQASHDPTFGLAVGAAALMFLATVASAWVSHRRVWLRLDGHKAQWVTIGPGGDPEDEFEALSGEIARLSLSPDSRECKSPGGKDR